MAEPARAFESQEHREMGAIAIAVARGYVVATPGAVASASRALEALDNIDDDYGELIQCVDFFLYPEKMLAYAWKLNATGRAKVPVGQDGLPDDRAKQLIPPDLVKKECDKQGVGFLQASHSNHAHFQQDLMMSLRLWHFMAVAMAQQEGNLYAALAINAIADHYLQDFFAPGHIVTPRDRLTDLPATATHDLANQMGALFQPRLTAKIKSVLGFICAPPVGKGAAQGRCVVRNDLLPHLQSPHHQLQIDRVPEETGSLLQDHRVLFRGDGFLGKPEQARQRLLLLAVQVASILDVLQGENTFKTTLYTAVDDGKNKVPSATLEFGSYDFSEHGKQHAGLVDEALATAASEADNPSRSKSAQAWSVTPCSWGGCDDRLYKLQTRAPIVSVSAQRESHSSGPYSARNVYNLELSTFGWLVELSRFSGRWLSGVELTPVVGYSLYKQGEFRGNGPTLRLAAAVPETEFSLGPYVRWLDYPSNGETTRKLSYGLRIDSGFSSYFTLYVAGGIDYAISPTGELQRGRVWSGGLRIGVPLTRLNRAP